MTAAEELVSRGWAKVATDPAVEGWVAAARPIAEAIATDPEAQAKWLRCGGTWFAGVNIFPNDRSGGVAGKVPALSGTALATAMASIGAGEIDLDPAQISVCYPGYPQPWEGETEANFRFRRDRDAAHVDGLLRDAARRRSLGEVHGFILGLPLNETPEDAAPLVVWEGSHHVIRDAFRARFAGIAPEDWAAEDVTDTYVATRKQIFSTCKRVAVHAVPGEAYVVHRLALHGVSPWGAAGGSEPRMIAYFRPDPFPGASPKWWLDAP